MWKNERRKKMKKENRIFRRLMTLVIVATMCLVVLPPVSADGPSGMVGYWKFDEGIGSTAYDETTNANDGTLSGGKFGNALEFDGVDDKVDFGDIDEMDGLSALTISLWVKPDSLSDLKSLVSKYSRTHGGWIIETSFSAAGGSNDLIFAPTDIAGHDWGHTSEDVLSVGVWTHVVMVYDGSGASNADKLKGYIDGNSKTLTFNDDIPSSLPSTTDPVYIGACIDIGRYFDGIIDEVGIWNRALSSSEVQQLFQGTFDDDTGLISFWHFDESFGTEVFDETTNDNDGVIHYATWAGPMWATGQVGKALSFDGVDDYVEVPDSSSLDITNAITIEAWFYNYGNIDPQMRWQRIIHKNYRKNYEMWIDSSTRLLQFRIGSGVGTTADTLSSGTTIQFNEWYHVAAVYDGSNMYLYLNGGLSNSKSTSIPSLGITTDPVIIGNVGNDISAFNYNRPFNGKIDEVAIYDTALSADEISYHYCLGFNFGHGYCDPPSLTYTGALLFGDTDDFVLQATLKDADENGMSGYNIEFFVNGGIVGTDSTNGDGDASINLNPKPVEVYEVYAKVHCIESDTVFIAVYDPTAGFVTGGGWIDSPLGAYRDDPTLTGKANFGFVSKYKKGQSTPTGNTEFKFKAGDLNFHSSEYDWLVIAGAKAMYKGTGTINDVGSYKFMITAWDGQINGGVDKFRIKIWEGDGNGDEIIVYDNGVDTPLGGGQIKIHQN